MAQQIHIVEDDITFGRMLTSFLERMRFVVSVYLNGESARKAITENNFDLLITDLKLPDDSGLDLLEFARKVSPNTKVILMTAYSEVDTAVKAIKRGALDYISKPFRPEELLMVIENGFSEYSETSSNVRRKSDLKQDSSQKPKIIDSPTFVMGISEISKKFNEYIKLDR